MPTRTAVVIAITITIAGPAAAARAAGWTSAGQLSAADASVDTIATAVSNDTKDLFVAWRRDSNAVEVASRPPGGPFTVTPLPGPTTVSSVVVAAGPGGRAIVAWQANFTIYVADRSPGGTFTVIGAVSGTAYSVAATVTSDGTEIVAWSDATGAFARAKPPGGVFGSTSTLYTNAPGENAGVVAAASDSGGNTLVAHRTVLIVGSSYTSTLRTSRRTPGSGFEPAQTVTSANITGSGASRLFDRIHIGFDQAGDALLTASDSSMSTTSGTTTTTSSVIASWRPPGAGTWSPVQQLEPPRVSTSGGGPATGTTAYAPTSAVDPTGAATATWSVNGLPSSSTIRTASAPSGGAAFAPANDVASSTDSASRYGGSALAPQPGGAMLLMDFHAGAFESGLRPAGAAVFGPRTPFTPPGQDVNGSELITSSDRDGDVIAAWSVFDSTALKRRTWSATYDASPPAFGDLTVPASATAGAPVAMSAAATDTLSSVAAVAWTFGDGGAGDGNAVSHTYAAPGDYTVTATATDAAGNAVSATRSVAIAPAAAPAVERPVIRAFSISPKRFAVGARATAFTARTPRGTKLRYDVSAPGTVTVTFARLVSGRRSGKRCVKPTRRLRKHKRCTRAMKVKRGLIRSVAAGPGTIAFSGRLARTALARGRYRARIVETVTGAPAPSLPRTATFTVVRYM
jgi:hypothetical protein